jgi:alpha-methylacyl-CoA racemase
VTGVAGPLAGLRVLEVPNLGPVQFAGMALADLGAEVLRLERASWVAAGAGLMPAEPWASLERNRRSVGIDLRHPEAAGLVRRLCERADVLVEGFRPGVAERLGIGPEACRAANPRLVYARITGWGRHGPLADTAGHDLTYLAVAGVLAHLGPAGGPPVPPINLLADFAGGGLLAAFGILAALWERERSGEGQVVDTAMVDGAAMLMSTFVGLAARGWWAEARGTNLLDGGAHFYGVYECADHRHLAVAAYEPAFYANLLRVLRPFGLGDLDGSEQMDRDRWPELRARLAAVFRLRTRDEWAAVFAGHEACVAPVLTINEARAHPQMTAREVFVEVAGAPQPAPAPRFSRTPGSVRRAPVPPGTDTDAALADWGLGPEEIARLREAGCVA